MHQLIGSAAVPEIY